MSDRLLQEIRDELETIRRTATIALEKMAQLGAGFAPVQPVTRVPAAGAQSPVARVRDGLPQDLLPKLKVLDQGSGLVSISTEWLERPDWVRLDKKIKSMGGAWHPAGKSSRWEIEGADR